MRAHSSITVGSPKMKLRISIERGERMGASGREEAFWIGKIK
jgi:hypothetical protein